MDMSKILPGDVVTLKGGREKVVHAVFERGMAGFAWKDEAGRYHKIEPEEIKSVREVRVYPKKGDVVLTRDGRLGLVIDESKPCIRVLFGTHTYRLYEKSWGGNFYESLLSPIDIVSIVSG